MKQKHFLILLLAVLSVNFLGLINDIFDVDSALYACIAKHIVNTNDFINLIVWEKDWLDKPHFPFWICAISMKIFGINSFAYKLPSFIFFCVGLWYTYRLAEKLYNKTVAQYSVLITGTALHIMLSNNDVRAEAILMGLIMGGIYHLYQFSNKNTILHLFAAALFSAFAVMTKGVFILIILYSAVWGDLILKKKWKNIIHVRWLLVLFFTLIFTLPELFALYYQFDAHPEKIVFGETNVSGIKFFLWDSQFGRFFNSGPIKGEGDIFFFLHTLLWAFAPWALIAYAGIFEVIYQRIKNGKIAKEYVTICGFGIIFLIFSVSKFQLPHYTNIVFPLLAIHTSQTVIRYTVKKKWIDILSKVSIQLYCGLFLLICIGIITFYFDEINFWGVILSVLLCISILLFQLRITSNLHQKVVVMGVVCSLVMGTFIHQVFYKDVLTYQGSVAAAKYINEEYKGRDVHQVGNSWLFQFYLEAKHHINIDLQQLKTIPIENRPLVYANKYFLEELREKQLPFRIVKQYGSFHITTMNVEFVNAKTRKESLDTFLIIDLNTSQLSDTNGNKKENL
ncbi:glycosyltransferase family 39 protein [Flammeovirga yaeyamensis]|uniref:Glycosyltransferase family 39 protein n=1 Tax=Flammeovirga yaeyamensis TaxID=367791 RepID=A0AAX1N603_9BACT|nr:glycosyltransferase family 39 protein [Flammeovirga yaeyamensis]MBB3697468.1 4-amino-4-deoxy-L-arabinose transferase-like glycosyltransferase [Flammeovirga yaeyamensis]NMF36162.1 glycosyl transferase [Flammeovirga yaeyamensis]QWG02895.1 glycosyltransferase family 39 protein [Flammeovirga yaeyamensis]